MSFEVDLPEARAELAGAFAAYERDLVANDLAALAAHFAPGEEVVRVGIADRQDGAAALAAWRASQAPLPPGRTLRDTVLTTYGRDVGVVTTAFTYPGRPFLGRQSQTWLRLDGRWRVVAAHVSEIPAAPG